MTSGRYDVAIVGGGPAGLAAARALAPRGWSVIVIEEHPTVGIPVHCTGVLGATAFAEFALPRHSIRSIVRSARFRGPDGRTIAVTADTGAGAAVVDRALFDSSLAELAGEAGAEIHAGCRVIDVEPSSTGVRLVVQGAREIEIVARAAVLACGAQYRFNRRLGLGLPRAYAHSAQVDLPFAEHDAVEIYLARALAPAGFAWVVPYQGEDGAPRARIGLMATDAAAVRFRRFYMLLRDRFEIRDVPAPRLKILPLGPVHRTYARRVLAVGDAAGLVKPTTGGGIYYSLLSGRLAAETLDEALSRDRLGGDHLRSYEKRWRERLGGEIRVGLAFRALVSRFDDRAINALVELAAVDGIIPLLRRTADFNWHRGTALALLRNPGFRRILLSALWS